LTRNFFLGANKTSDLKPPRYLLIPELHKLFHCSGPKTKEVYMISVFESVFQIPHN